MDQMCFHFANFYLLPTATICTCFCCLEITIDSISCLHNSIISNIKNHVSTEIIILVITIIRSLNLNGNLMSAE